MQVWVDMKKDGPHNLRRAIFQLTCYGESDTQSSKMILRQGQVDRTVANVCKERVIRVAYNLMPPFIYIHENTMLEFPRTAEAPPNEILSSFFKYNKLTPLFIDCNFDWVSIDEKTGMWQGIMGEVKEVA